jgi:hypothetical protein
MTHSHTWQLINSALRRYRCSACNVIGYAPANQRRVILPYVCKLEVDGRRHCGKPAVHAGHLATQHRCGEHVVAKEQAA